MIVGNLIDCEQSSVLLLSSVARAMDLSSGQAARNAAVEGRKKSLLVHFSNLHNFTVTFRALFEGKGTTASSLEI